MAIKIPAASQAVLNQISALSDAELKKTAESAMESLATVDGDRVLDTFEAEALGQVFATLVPPGTTVTDQLRADVKSALEARIGELKAERASSTDAIFTSEGEALDRFRGRILGNIDAAINKAAGRPVDVNMMLFAFTDKKLADGLVERAKQHPNVTFRLLTDWSQLATSGSRQPPRLVRIAEDQGLTNLQVKFKKDEPYIWSNSQNRPVFSHGQTKGLNHHKGFVTLVDGRPENMAMGSFNWSVSAMTTNYENLLLLDRKDPDNRPVMSSFEAEFEAFWNNDDAALQFNAARKEKERQYAALYAQHGVPFTPANIPPDDVIHDDFVAEDKSAAFDINSFEDRDALQLEALLGKGQAEAVFKELRDYGRFDSWTELLARVPELASASTWTLEKLRENLEYGDGGLSINRASVEELDRAGLSRSQAERVVAFREQHGAFESVGELDDVKGIGKATLERLASTLTDDENIATFSARVVGQNATTGYAEGNRGTISLPTEGNNEVDPLADDGRLTPNNRANLEAVDRTMDAPVADLLRRAKPGQTFRLAMYGISPSSPEFKEMERAVGRGVKLRAVVYNAYNEAAIDALQALKDQGFDVDFRIIKARVMHQKFGLVGDDVFNGSANMSLSSITKHSEDRFLFRNSPALAQRFLEEFSRLWEKGYENH